MATITDNDLKVFQERAKTEFASRCDTGGIAWDSVIWDLCNEVRRLRSASNERANYAKLREAAETALKTIRGVINSTISPRSNTVFDCRDKLSAALAAPARNCDVYPAFDDAISALADKNGWHDGKWDSERYCILASWLLAHATEKKGGAK